MGIKGGEGEKKRKENNYRLIMIECSNLFSNWEYYDDEDNYDKWF